MKLKDILKLLKEEICELFPGTTGDGRGTRIRRHPAVTPSPVHVKPSGIVPGVEARNAGDALGRADACRPPPLPASGCHSQDGATVTLNSIHKQLSRMKILNNILSIIAAAALVACCGGAPVNEAQNVYDEGLLLNDDMVAVSNEDGTVSFKNAATNKVTIDGIDLDWVIRSPHDSLAVFSSKGKRGYYNVYTGEIAVPAQYRRAWVFADGLAAVQKNGEIGFIDHSGNVVIDFLFPYHGNPLSEFVFEDGLCVVANREGKCGVIDRKGAWVIPAEYDNVSAYKEYAIVSKDGVAMQVGYDGKVINSFVLDSFYELTFDEEQTYVDRDGELRVGTREVGTGLYAYSIGGRYGLLDGKTFKRLTEPLYKDIEAVSKTLFRACLLDYSSEVILNQRGEVLK